MKNFFKKVGNFFSYMIMPRKMSRFAHMNLFFGFLLFIVCLMISYSSSNMTADKYVLDVLGDSYFVNYQKNNYIPVGEEVVLPSLEYILDSDGNYYYATCKSFPTVNGTEQHIFDQQYRDSSTNKLLNVKVVYELAYFESTPNKEEEILIPEKFQGTYVLSTNDKNHIVEVLATGKGYYDGKKISFTHNFENDTISSTVDETKITISLNEGNYVVQVTNLNITKVDRLFSTSDLKYFDFQSYFEEKTEVKENEDDVLIIFTRNLVYYLYNRGYVPSKKDLDYNYITMPDKKGVPQHPIYDYYLPKDRFNALQDPKEWEVEAKFGQKVEIDGVEYEAYPRTLKSSLAEIFAYNSPVLSYHYAKSAKLDIFSTSPSTLSKLLTNFNVSSWTDSVKFQTSCTAGVPFGFILPILCITITWLMSRKRGNLKSFKEYFNLAAFASIPVAILSFIIGFFFQYTTYVYFLVVVQLGFYIFAAFRVNTMQETFYETSSTGTTLTIDTTIPTIEKSEEEAPNEQTNDNDDLDTPNYIG